MRVRGFHHIIETVDAVDFDIEKFRDPGFCDEAESIFRAGVRLADVQVIAHLAHDADIVEFLDVHAELFRDVFLCIIDAQFFGKLHAHDEISRRADAAETSCDRMIDGHAVAIADAHLQAVDPADFDERLVGARGGIKRDGVR